MVVDIDSLPPIGATRSAATIDEIAGIVADVFGFSIKEIKGMNRHKDLAQARNALCWLSHVGERSFSDIAHFLGGRDHTTIMSNAGSANRLYDRNVDFQAKIDDCRGKIEDLENRQKLQFIRHKPGLAAFIRSQSE